ncbi:hypothetical protein ACLOJK_010668 [Asimina triloba]
MCPAGHRRCRYLWLVVGLSGFPPRLCPWPCLWALGSGLWALLSRPAFSGLIYGPKAHWLLAVACACLTLAHKLAWTRLALGSAQYLAQTLEQGSVGDPKHQASRNNIYHLCRSPINRSITSFITNCVEILEIFFIIFDVSEAAVPIYLTVAKETEFELWGFIFVMLAAIMSGFRWSMTQILLQVVTEYILVATTSAVTITVAGVVKEAVTILLWMCGPCGMLTAVGATLPELPLLALLSLVIVVVGAAYAQRIM